MTDSTYTGIVANPYGTKGKALLDAGVKQDTQLGAGRTLNNGVITTDKLASATPITVPNPTPLTGVTSTTGAITSTTDTNKAQSEADAKLAGLKTTKDTSLSDYLDNILALGKEPAKQSQIITDMGGDQAKIDADSYGSQIEAEQLATRHAVEGLKKNNPQGLFGGALDSKINDLNSTSLSKQADLAILQNTALKKYDVASDIATRKVQAETEGLKASLDARKLIYENNKDSFDKEEQRQIDAKIKKDDREYQQTVADKTAINAILLEVAKNGGSSSQISAISSAKTPQEAITKAGKLLATPSTEVVKLDNGNSVLIDKRTGNIIRNIGGGAVDPSTIVPTSVVRTTTVDGKTKPVDGYELKAGDDPYVVAQNNGIDFKTMQALNPDVKDWNNLPVGTVLNLPSKDSTWLNGKTQDQINAYNNLPDADKASVKQLVNGDALLTDIVKSRGAKTQGQITALINKATAIDPNFSINSNKIKYATNQKWNDPNGKSFLTRTSINTALDHASNLYQNSVALGNTSIPKFNDVANWTSKNSGNPALTNYVYDLTVLASEIASAYKGSSATDQETEKVFNAFSGSSSPAQFKGVIEEALKTMSGKLSSLAQEYKQSTGAYPEDPIIHPDVLLEAKNLGLDTSKIDTLLESQGYTAVKQDPNTTSINNFLSGKKSGSGNTLEDLWNK